MYNKLSMSSDIPGFYFDAVQQRYYRISSESPNNVPSARAINERARQEQLIAKQIDLIRPSSRSSFRRNKKLNESRLSVLRQRTYGQTPIRKINYTIN